MALVVDNQGRRGYTVKVPIPIEDKLAETFIFKASGSEIMEPISGVIRRQGENPAQRLHQPQVCQILSPPSPAPPARWSCPGNGKPGDLWGCPSDTGRLVLRDVKV